jgi:hypothetical protein
MVHIQVGWSPYSCKNSFKSSGNKIKDEWIDVLFNDVPLSADLSSVGE